MDMEKLIEESKKLLEEQRKQEEFDRRFAEALKKDLIKHKKLYDRLKDA